VIEFETKPVMCSHFVFQTKDILDWTVYHVGAFLWRNKLLKVADKFIDECISGDVLLMLTEQDLKKLNIGIAQRRKLMSVFIELHKLHSGQLREPTAIVVV